MKIINKNCCYVQLGDILYLRRNDSKFPEDLYYYVLNNYAIRTPLNKYNELKDKKYYHYILESNMIFDYDFLNSKTVDELNELCDEVIRQSNVKCSRLVLSSLKHGNENANIRKNLLLRLSVSDEINNRKYLISQIKDIQKEKEDESKLKLRRNS